MSEPLRRAYLEAIGLDVWVARPPRPQYDRLLISPGQGSALLICQSAEESVTKLAGDIARALGEELVWAWPDPAGGPDSPTVEQAVVRQLFTRVIVFGPALANQLFRGEIPQILVSSAVSVASSLDELGVSGTVKQALWNSLRRWNGEAAVANPQ